MSKVCDICSKGPSTGFNVSHSHRKTKRRWLPNLQRVRVVIDDVPKKIRACTACIRSGKVEKPSRVKKAEKPSS